MIKRSDLRTHRWRTAVLAITAALALTGAASAQVKKADTNVATGYSTVDLSVFAGWQWFQFGQGTHGAIHQFAPAGSWGERLTEDVHKYIGLEEGIQIGYNRIKLLPVGGSSFSSTGGSSALIYGAGVLHLAPRDAKYRPFILVGPGYIWYHERSPGFPGANNNASNRTALVYGIGLKINETPRWGVRFDLRGMRSGTPRFGLPGVPGAPGTYWIPGNNLHESSLTASVGVVFRLRYHAPPAPVAAAPPPPPPAPKANVQVTGVTGAQDVCAGSDVRLTVNASGWLPDQTPSYQWMVDGSPVSGATGSSFNVPTEGSSGTKSITVKVTAGDSSATSNPVSVTVKPLAPPSVSFAVSPSTVAYGATIPLSASANASECGGPATIRYSGEGVSGSTFDSKALSFDTTNRLKQQSKTVHITATATDQKNQTASAGADVTVTLKAEARRLDDIVFQSMSSRVNNCAKRLLLEELTPMLRADPGAKVILVGHRDASEKGRAGATLDQARVINSAAVLSAGKGICPSLDLSRVMVNWVGDQQGSETRPALCGSSTNVKERGGQGVRETDKRAQYRRVEVWIVPSGAEMPAGISGLKEAPAKDIQAKGCPK
jgi:outer membrane protein OmpA-like peptidoglycan-associated protein/opacity protein-like surface antigen